MQYISVQIPASYLLPPNRNSLLYDSFRTLQISDIIHGYCKNRKVPLHWLILQILTWILWMDFFLWNLWCFVVFTVLFHFKTFNKSAYNDMILLKLQNILIIYQNYLKFENLKTFFLLGSILLLLAINWINIKLVPELDQNILMKAWYNVL